MYSNMKMGLSICFSWAWASSLVIGQSIAIERGIIPFLIWALANTLTLGLFGCLFKKGLFTESIFKNKIFKSFAIVIQAFCLIINLNILNQLVDNYWLTTAIGLFFIALMYPRGLISSIATDQVQGIITFVALLGIIGFGLGSGAEISTHIINSDGGVLWALWSACILLTSPFGDVQMWQRARVNPHGFWWASGFFGLYMCCIFVMSMFEFNSAMNMMLLAACLAVTTSTIDSIAVAMLYFDTELYRRKKARKDTTDYKAKVFELFEQPERFTTPSQRINYKYFKRFVMLHNSFMDNKHYKVIYQTLLGGDPKKRTHRSLYTQVFGGHKT